MEGSGSTIGFKRHEEVQVGGSAWADRASGVQSGIKTDTDSGRKPGLMTGLTDNTTRHDIANGRGIVDAPLARETNTWEHRAVRDRSPAIGSASRTSREQILREADSGGGEGDAVLTEALYSLQYDNRQLEERLAAMARKYGLSPPR